MAGAGDPERPSRKGDDIPWRKIAFVALAIYSALFLILNDDKVEISFVLFSAETSLIFLILISMGLGAALAIFGPAWWRRRKRRGTVGNGGDSDSAPL